MIAFIADDLWMWGRWQGYRRGVLSGYPGLAVEFPGWLFFCGPRLVVLSAPAVDSRVCDPAQAGGAVQQRSWSFCSSFQQEPEALFNSEAGHSVRHSSASCIWFLL
jgi:hypothetical protein